MTYRNDDVIVAEMQQAKKDDDVQKCRDLIVEMLLPEAEEVLKLSEKDITHKDGYPTVMAFLSGIPKQYKPFMVKALKQVGYPTETLEIVSNNFSI